MADQENDPTRRPWTPPTLEELGTFTEAVRQEVLDIRAGLSQLDRRLDLADTTMPGISPDDTRAALAVLDAHALRIITLLELQGGRG